MCSLKRKVKVKVTKFYVGWEELINAYKPTKLGIRVINGVKENKLKSMSVVCSLKREVKVKVTKFYVGFGRTHQSLKTYQVRHTCD